MSDNLNIFGTTYSNVTGIKATDTNNVVQTFIKPSGTKSITANGTGIDVTEYASVDVSVSPTIEALTVTPTTSQQVFNSANLDGYKPVTVNAMPSGTAGTPTATKGTVSNHSVSVTPSVTNTTGYITGSTKTGTAVTVSASELVSGSETKTANGTYDVTNLAQLVVNVSSTSKNVQVAQSTTRATSSTYTELVSLTCSVTGTYDVYWSTFRSSTSGTSGSQLYINDNAYGTADTGSWSNHVQNIHLTNVSLTANDEVAVRARSRGSNYYAYVGTLTIIQKS